MPIITIFDLPTMDADKYRQAIRELEAAGQGQPQGRLYHVAADQDDGGTLVTDVWESQALLDAFGQTLVPVLTRAGVTPVEPRVYPVRNIIEG